MNKFSKLSHIDVFMKCFRGNFFTFLAQQWKCSFQVVGWHLSLYPCSLGVFLKNLNFLSSQVLNHSSQLINPLSNNNNLVSDDNNLEGLF